MKLQNSKGIAFVTVILGMVLLSAFGIGLVSLVSTNTSRATEGLNSQQAFYVAEGGMQYLLMKQVSGDTDLSNNVSPTDAPFGPNSISLSPGQFWIEYSNQSSTNATVNATVKVTARVGQSVRVIQQTATVGGAGFSHNVAMAGGNINMNNSTGNIYGDVGLKGTANIAPAVNVHGNITQDPSIVLPTIDFNTYKNMTTTTNNGDMEIESNYTGNLLVKGKVEIGSNVTFTGVLYATNNITLDGNNIIFKGTVVTEQDFKADGRTGLQFKPTQNAQVHMPAILSNGAISMKNSDGMKVDGIIWNPGNVDLSNSDNMDFNGSFMVGGNMLMNTANNIKINFVPTYITSVPGRSTGVKQGYNAIGLSGWKTY